MSHRHIIFALSAAVCAAPLGAKDISGLKAGQLQNAGIEPTETVLKISGTMNAADFFYIFDNLNNLQSLNLQDATIVAYKGEALPYLGLSESPANTIPAFSLTGLKNLQTIVLPASLTKIDKGALSGTGIRAINIPGAVKEIGDYAMMRCTDLKSVAMTSSVTSIGTRAFAYCSALESIQLSPAIETIPEGLFEACGGLKSLNLAHLADCYEIGPWALAECKGVNTLVLPAGAEVIDDCALYGTAMVDYIELPAGVSYLGNGAMGGMSGLSTIKVDEVGGVPELGNNVWSQVAQNNVVLVTPDDLDGDYRAADQWKNFNIINKSNWQSSTDAIEAPATVKKIHVVIDGNTMKVDADNAKLGKVSVFDAAGRQVASKVGTQSVNFNVSSWTSGVYLVVSGAGISKVSI